MEKKMTKWETWYNQLPPGTRAYLARQACWHDSDVLTFTTVSFLVGLTLGLVL
jgi:hypothetical protein